MVGHDSWKKENNLEYRLREFVALVPCVGRSASAIASRWRSTWAYVAFQRGARPITDVRESSGLLDR